MNTQAMSATSSPANSALWQAVLTRDRTADGTFVYGVASTKIYCRPVCPSRRPRPDGIHFFATPAQAEAAGFRACHRCQPRNAASPTDAWLAASRDYLDKHGDRTVPLAELSKFAGVHASHLQRAFQQAYGLSPRAYQAAQRTRTLTRALPAARSVTDALYDSGFNSAAAAYASTRALGIAPKAARSAAAGENIVFAITTTPLGKLLAAATHKGLCRVAFADTSGSLTTEIQAFRSAFHAAHIVDAGKKSADLPPTHASAVEVLQAALPALQALASGEQAASIPVDLRGTAFQQKVWKALRQIPRGQTRSYSQVAAQLGQPSAARAVARACATNTLALAVPCHRVNATSGELAGYRWGIERKRSLQASESRSDSVKRHFKRGKSTS